MKYRKHKEEAAVLIDDESKNVEISISNEDSAHISISYYYGKTRAGYEIYEPDLKDILTRTSFRR